MNKVVLVILGRPSAVCACLDAATYATRILGGGARIIALAPRVAAETTVLPSEEVLTARRRADLERRADAAIAVLRDRFTAWQREGGGDAEWIEDRGVIEAEVARHGQAVEFVVVASGPAPQDHLGSALRAALLETHRPVIVVPDRLGPSIGHHIAIAWHEDEPATKAVLAAMPFLAAAERVWVLEASRSTQPHGELPAILREHRIGAELRTITVGHAGIGAALLAEAHALGADLLVMGAFAHSPLVESLLGGVTRTVLHAAEIPLLLRH